jgi:diguanylate cyclase (GGDEF)-like protein
VTAAVFGADLLTLIFYSIFFADRLLLDLLLTSLIVVSVAFPLSYFFMARSAGFAELAAELERASRTDDLTGLLNRRTFFREVKRRIELDAAGKGAGTLLFIDADHFKSVNDTFGHAIGDTVLRELAVALRTSINEDDLVGRLGGEEFVVLLTGAGHEKASQICENIGHKVKAVSGVVGLGKHKITVSIGASVHRPGQDLDTLLLAADRNLYAAKVKGRDRTIQDEPERAAA